MRTVPPLLWEPAFDLSSTVIGQYLSWLREERQLQFDSYDALWRWSISDVEVFWQSIAEYFGVNFTNEPSSSLGSRSMPGAQWFPGSKLSYAEHALRTGVDDDVAIVARSQTRAPLEMTWKQLRSDVARTAASLRRMGVSSGDRVVGFLPNIPEAVVAFLATASIGAIWASCAPEFGTRSVIDRLAQLEPKVLFAVGGYRYGAAEVDRREAVGEILEALPSVEHTIVVPYGHHELQVPRSVTWLSLLAEEANLDFEAVPFDHPLYVLFSSGTTGLPKPIAHGHGGILVEHLKCLSFHQDLSSADRFFWFTTTGWTMWNCLVSGLLVGSSIVLFDGNPVYPDLQAIWDLADETETTWLGISASYVAACDKAGLLVSADTSRLRAVGSTGSSLSPEGFRWLKENVCRTIPIWSASGGTDVCSAFVAGSPMVPVWEGEISVRALGAAVAAFDELGNEVVGEAGQLVITKPMPSMPLGFWGDTEMHRYRETYFVDYPGVWKHGDWITLTDRGSCVIRGRSDATLNRGGIRLGTSEFYSVVESDPNVADSLVVHLEDPTGGPGELILFVVVSPSAAETEGLAEVLTARLKRDLSPRHAPDTTYFVNAIPRTLSGKKLEIPVKQILNGAAPEQSVSYGSMREPRALEPFVKIAAARGRRVGM